ncbi:MAG: Lrp/AsnC family transcriptional regulator [Dehalococcoidia bacterium]|nr:Lrp/AsnC family transcriptional regulator [Dehalococcoidia bacterium]
MKEKEKEVFRILEKDARTKPEQIAGMTGLPLAQVEKTIKKAEQERVILKYKTLINWEKLGEETVWALIEVRVSPQRDVGFDAVAERIYRFPQVRSMYLVSGTYDLSVVVTGKTMQEVAGFVAQKLAPLESIQGTVTHFLLKRYKEDGEILEGEEQTRRQPLIL